MLITQLTIVFGSFRILRVKLPKLWSAKVLLDNSKHLLARSTLIALEILLTNTSTILENNKLNPIALNTTTSRIVNFLKALWNSRSVTSAKKSALIMVDSVVKIMSKISKRREQNIKNLYGLK